ncbi:MAG: GNAT family N-acetyltransferase [Tepidiformaceae bacterium]
MATTKAAASEAGGMAAFSARYPRNVPMRDGRQLQLRLMGRGDRDLVLAFARALPADDLLFLRNDITEAPSVDEWIANIETGHSTAVLAVDGEHLAGYAALHYQATSWTRHIGEIRLLTAPGYRGMGLGRMLAGETYAVGRALGLKKLSAQMTLDQAGARSTFERLGFKPEALLTDFVIDANGRTRDLLVMAYDLDGLTDTVDV